VGHPVFLVVLGLFIVYPLYCFSYTHGFGLIVLTVFDVVAMGMIGTNIAWSVAIWHLDKAIL